MAIKKGLIPQLAEVGKIKIGEKGAVRKSQAGNDYQLPTRLDYFKITTTERDKKTGNYFEDVEIMKKLGGKPKEVKIRLPFDTVDKNFFTQYMCYVGNKKVCAGDGETANRKGKLTKSGDKIKQSGEGFADIPCDPDTCPAFQCGSCKVSGILSAFLTDAPDIGGVHKFRTHGWNSTSTILGALEYFSKNTGGILQGLPLKLVLLKKTTEKHGTINYATVVIDGEQIKGLRKLALEEKQDRELMHVDILQIEQQAEQSGFFKDTDNEKDIQEEFYPEEPEPEEKPVIKNVTGTSTETLKQELKDKKVVVGKATDKDVKTLF